MTELTAKYISIYKYSEALKYANQGLVKVRQLSDTPRLIKLYRLKAMTFRKLNDVDSSIILLQQILPIAKMKNDIEEIKFTLNGLGLSYLSMAAYDKALKYYFELFDYPLESGSITKDVPTCNIGVVYYKLKEYKKALEYFQESLAYKKANHLKSYDSADKLQSERLKLDNIILLAEISIKQNKAQGAEVYLEEAEKIISAGSSYNLELIKLYAILYSFYSKASNVNKMLFYQNKYIQLRDSIYNEEMMNNLMKFMPKTSKNKMKLVYNPRTKP